MFKKLDKILNRYKELEKLTVDPEVIQNITAYRQYAKEMARLRPLASKYESYLHIKKEIDILASEINVKDHDKDYIELAKEEIQNLKQKMQEIDRQLEDGVFENEDGDSAKNVIMELRAGTGGIEAALFASDLYKMYAKYAVKKGWKIETLSLSTTEKGGIKEIIFSVAGNNVYSIMKYESGTHRVQRVPATEASGRIHTSAATVAVLPEAEELDVTIKPQDLKIDVFRAGGRGGQHVNVTDSAVRMTHLPTGLVVSCQDERSQHKNKAKAMRVLRTRLYEKLAKDQHNKISKDRKIQVGSGDRSEKIRTYNFPDRRVTDHRVNLTLHKLEAILSGDLDEIVETLREAERKKRRNIK
ncbi:MAG: peptide chain release factor 1 [Candidatus Omnitrophica bacterium]|nr:peptide chain release factor 1 [Candidatus Omnitrophota bacterium]